MGIGAYVRAVNVPLAGFCLFYFRAVGQTWRQAALRAAAASAIAFVVLSPWVLRNHARYGEWFLTDSHGGLTALVGANPNTDGRYSRSLNRLFHEVTGYTLLAEPHRQADRASYELARRYREFSPAFAAGLVVVKAERLLAHERSLLYWPLYRQGVLPPGSVRDFFDRARPRLERVTDGFWLLLVASFFAGMGLAVARRRWVALAFVPIQLALAGVYALYFAEVRYHLPIAVLMFPLAAVAMIEGVRGLQRVIRARGLPPGWRVPVLWAGAGLAVLAVGWPTLGWAGERLRERHRFAAHVCQVDGRAEACLWRPASGGDSPVRGVWDGLGLALRRRDASGVVAAAAEVVVPAGRWRVETKVDVAPIGAANALSSTGTGTGTGAGTGTGTGQVTFSAGGRPVASVPLAQVITASARGATVPLQATVDHAGGPLPLELRVSLAGPAPPPTTSLWLAALKITRAE